MPRFALVAHDHPSPHWDLFLEAGDVLRTWRVAPLVDGVAVAAEAIGDHRPMYLDYEGPVSGGRGTVTRIDAGTFHWDCDDREIIVRLVGSRYSGKLRIADGAATFLSGPDPAPAAGPTPP